MCAIPLTPPLAPLAPTRGKLLVVDDSRTARFFVGRCLRRAGFEVFEAPDAESALARLDELQPEVVLTDLHMPGMDGFTLIEKIRARGEGPEVIVMTGTHANDMAAAVRALRLGAHDFLTKPLPDGPAFEITIERALEKKRLRATNRRLMRELEALTRTDALTGVLNRRAFEETVRRELSRARRHGFPVSLILFDLDHFKRVNDEHGHPAGDAVLQAFARMLGGEIRETDSVFRYGGEEFAVALTHTALPEAVCVGERLLARTRALSVGVAGRALRLTASAGAACAEGAALDPDSLVSRADQALYEAKRRGRDRVVGAGGLDR